jgi:hypothetical protein
MLMINGRGCYQIAREPGARGSRLTVTLPHGRADGGDLLVRQDDSNVWWAYSPSIGDYVTFVPTEPLTRDLTALECEFRANELIGWEYRPHAFPALATASARHASQARVAELERQQRSRRDEIDLEDSAIVDSPPRARRT